MLQDSDSPNSALQKLSDWLSLPETQEVLQLLEDKALEADKAARRSPSTFRDVKTQEFYPLDHVRCLQDRFIGNSEGLRELKRLLTFRQEQLTNAILNARQEEDQRHA